MRELLEYMAGVWRSRLYVKGENLPNLRGTDTMRATRLHFNPATHARTAGIHGWCWQKQIVCGKGELQNLKKESRHNEIPSLHSTMQPIWELLEFLSGNLKSQTVCERGELKTPREVLPPSSSRPHFQSTRARTTAGILGWTSKPQIVCERVEIKTPRQEVLPSLRLMLTFPFNSCENCCWKTNCASLPFSWTPYANAAPQHMTGFRALSLPRSSSFSLIS